MVHITGVNMIVVSICISNRRTAEVQVRPEGVVPHRRRPHLSHRQAQPQLRCLGGEDPRGRAGFERRPRGSGLRMLWRRECEGVVPKLSRGQQEVKAGETSQEKE